MHLDPPVLPGKLLIAGEFTVMIGGAALAVPLHRFFGTWNFEPGKVDTRLLTLIPHVQSLPFLNHILFESEVHNGLFFESNIPQGYGLGSSGALSAALLDRYHLIPPNPETIQKILASIEDSFHGNSSGFDPLISYTRTAHMIRNKVVLPLGQLKDLHTSTILKSFYLIDSEISRGEMSPIDWYFKEMENKTFQQAMIQLNSLNENMIEALLTDDVASFHPAIKAISEFQFELFKPLIAPSLVSYWSEGLTSDRYYMKLCGKGGGGYYLLWANRTEDTNRSTKPWIPAI